MVKISGHMVAVVVVDHNQGLMTKTKNGIFGYQELEGKLHKNFVYFYVKFSMHTYTFWWFSKFSAQNHQIKSQKIGKTHFSSKTQVMRIRSITIYTHHTNYFPTY